MPLLVCLATFLSGCSGRIKQSAGHVAGPLMELATAYQRATHKLDRAPKDADELKPFLDEGKEVGSLLRSPADGEEYVILWGTDPRAGMALKPLVIGYEKKGMDGTRFVFTAMGVSLMSEKDFQNARFPEGHKPN